MKSFIDENQIIDILKKSEATPKKEIERIIIHALSLKGLELRETSALLQCQNRGLIAEIYKAAKIVKENIYGKRLVLFAPLYITSYCVNNCIYCGFRKGNKDLKRRRLTLSEIMEQVRLIEQEGHKRILLVGGEDPVIAKADFLKKAIAAIYKTKTGKGGEIRRINVNVAPMSTRDFARLSKTGIGTYQLFQETYHRDTYSKMHAHGPKADYEYRLYAMHRAQEGGINDVGIGVLFGLYDYRFEVLALLSHAQALEKDMGVGPHTISVPRLEPAFNAPAAKNPPVPVSDEDFKKLVAILRLAVPYTGLILSTREETKLRNELFGLGISQISAGSRTAPGGYQSSEQKHPESEQFTLHDSRSLLEVIKDISKMGYSPSFCTACYRLGRTGKDFMDLAKPGLIQNFCLPNSLLTYIEYLLDYGDEESQKIGNKLIDQQLEEIRNPALRELVAKKLSKTATGERDLYC